MRKFAAILVFLALPVFLLSCLWEQCKILTSGAFYGNHSFNDSLAVVQAWFVDSPHEGDLTGPSCGDNANARVGFFMVNTLRHETPVRAGGYFPSSVYVSGSGKPPPGYKTFAAKYSFYVAVFADSSLSVLRFNADKTSASSVYKPNPGAPKYFAAIGNQHLFFYDSSVTLLENGTNQSVRYPAYLLPGADYLADISVYGDTVLARNSKTDSICIYRKIGGSKSAFCAADTFSSAGSLTLSRDTLVYRGALQQSTYPVSKYRLDFASRKHILISQENQPPPMARFDNHHQYTLVFGDSVTYYLSEFE